MNSKPLWLIVGATLILGGILYFYLASRCRLEIDPNAAEEIEKAKRR